MAHHPLPRHRVQTYSHDQNGETVELQLHNFPSPERATAAARSMAKRRRGVLVYSARVNAEGEIVEAPTVHLSCGDTPRPCYWPNGAPHPQAVGGRLSRS